MNRYLVLYNSPVPAAEMMAQVTPEQAQAGMDLWTAWDHPHFHTRGGTIDVLEFLAMPGM